MKNNWVQGSSLLVIYTTKDCDVLDHICWKYYGTSDAVHQVLQANPHLTKFDYVLPRGVQIKLPVLEKQQINREVRLWD